MAGQGDEQDGDLVGAIERVLKAERDGVEKLRQSAAAADHLLTETRAQVAALARRTDRRISKLHAAYLQKIDRDICALTQAQTAKGATASERYDAATLAAAAARVAAKLTGGA